MNRTELIYNGISEIVGGNGMAIVILTDVERRRALNVVCDDVMKNQIGIRDSGWDVRYRFLPEVMLQMLTDCADISRYEITIHDIVEGEYKTMIVNLDTLNSYAIRLSDAILLSRISKIPIYIDETLMRKQCSVYNGNTNRMAIPINTISTDKLREELDKAVEEENYRLASVIKDELNKRGAKKE